MFVFSVRSSTLKFCATLLFGVMLVSALVLLLPVGDEMNGGAVEAVGDTEASIRYDGISDYEDMADFLKQFGWEVKKVPESDDTVRIPSTFGQSFAEYNKMQLSQGFDFGKLGGKSVQKVTFEVLNYPQAQGKVLATLFVYREKIVGGDISSADPTGFVVPFSGEYS